MPVKLPSAHSLSLDPATVTIDMVTVGNPRNANDPLTGNVYGGVDHEYNIGKYEVSIRQYTIFLNAVAAKDPYGLYNPSMGTDVRVAGIRRNVRKGSYTYKEIIPSGSKPAGGDSPGNRPITYIDWFDAARFANWMHNGQGSGSTETGAYTLNGATSGNAVAVNPGAKFYIPTESEWYKAAYYSPTLNLGTGGYYLYATQSNSAPGNTIGSAPNQANYYGDSGTYSLTQSPFLVNNQNYLTNVGAFPNSASFYGTFDQGGNAYEWNDMTGAAGPLRSLRSGFFQSNQGDLTVLDRYVSVPVANFSGSGFRLAAPVSLPVITLAMATTAGVTEDGTTNLIYTFSRTGPTTSALTVSFTVGGSATLGSDYTGIATTPATKTVTFASNSSTATVTVDPTSDTTIEPTETVELTLVADSSYTIGTNAAVVGTILNDDISALKTTKLRSTDSNLLLLGDKRIDGIGNDLSNNITGNNNNNRLSGLLGADVLTGGGTLDRDLFVFKSLRESLLGEGSSFDVITDFSNRDRILAPRAVEGNRLASSLGRIDSLTPTSIQALLTNVAFVSNSVAAFSVTGQSGTFIAMNDGRDGFQAQSDALVFLRNYTVSAENFVTFA